jgi:hypothetical protein
MPSLDSVKDSLGPIFAILGITSPTAQEEYAAAMANALHWMPGQQFHECVKTLAIEMHGGRRPVPAQVVAIWHKLADKFGWKYKPRKKCSRCNDARFVRAAVRDRRSGHLYASAKPCSSCNGSLAVAASEDFDGLDWNAYADAPPVFDGRPVQVLSVRLLSDDELSREVAAFSPKGARASQTIIAAFPDLASKYPNATNLVQEIASSVETVASPCVAEREPASTISLEESEGDPL